MRRGTPVQNNVYNIFDGGSGKKLDGTVTVQLPAFELMSNTFKGAGVGGEINVPVSGVMKAVKATLSVSVIYGALTNYLELSSTRWLDLRNEIIVASSNGNEKVPNRWVLKGPLSKADPGKVAQGEPGDASIEMEVYYAHHWLDGDDVLEWDVFKRIYTVNGKDMLAETRRNILDG